MGDEAAGPGKESVPAAGTVLVHGAAFPSGEEGGRGSLARWGTGGPSAPQSTGNRDTTEAGHGICLQGRENVI